MIENAEFQSHYRTARSLAARLPLACALRACCVRQLTVAAKRGVPARRFLVLIPLPSAEGRRNAAVLQMQMGQLAETPLVRRARERL
jgi:hypothetical protein